MIDTTMTLSVLPALETKRLTLRAVTLDDTTALLRIGGDQRVTRYLSLPLLTSIEEATQRVNALLTEFRQQTGIRWAVCLRGETQMIGTCGYRQWLKPHFRAEIGYMIAPEFWGQGLVPEACRAVIDFGFAEMGLHSVEAHIDPENVGSQRVLEKLGFVREGYFRENIYLAAKGRFVDTAVYGLLKAQWMR